MKSFIMRYYTLTVKHDNGKVKLKTAATSEQAARKIIQNNEGCPDCAIIKVKTGKLVKY